MENNIGIRIYVRNGSIEHVVPESPWEGQMDIQIIIEDDKDSEDIQCQDDPVNPCPEGPDPHRHKWWSTAVIRAEVRKIL